MKAKNVALKAKSGVIPLEKGESYVERESTVIILMPKGV